MLATRKTVPCVICGDPTPWIGTQRCNRCWHLERQIKDAPALTRKILAELDTEKEVDLPAQGVGVEDLG